MKVTSYELFVGYGPGASAIRVGELQEDPLTRFLLRYDEFETGGELRDGKGAQIKMGKDSEPLQSGKGRALNVKVAQTCLALHVSHQFTHFAATDGGKDQEDNLTTAVAPIGGPQHRPVHALARWRRLGTTRSGAWPSGEQEDEQRHARCGSVSE